MSYWYLGSPYSKHPDGIEEAHRAVCRAAARLIKQGIPVFSPIAHTHPIALAGDLDPLDHELWLPADEPMIKAAVGLIVLELEGWETSKGLAYEITRFSAAGKPILHLSGQYAW